MEQQILMTFTDNNKYQIELSPPRFWMPFAKDYNAIPWIEISDERLAIIAENYSYMLDILVQARLYYLSTMPIEERYK
jgi:hypothetical protein